MEDDDIVLLLSDDGVGIDQDLMPQLLNGTHHSAQSKGTNIAVYNTHRRLQILYGERYGLSYTSTKGSGTEVQLRIPAILPDRHNNENPQLQVQSDQVLSLLSNSELSMYEIVLKCGYQNLDEFYTDFQDSYGYTPEEYRMHFL